MANDVKLTFAGDASKLQSAAKRAEQAVQGVGDSATSASEDFNRAAQGAGGFTDRAGKLGAAVDGASTAIGDAAGTMQALVDIQQAGKNRAAALARALNDAEQAQNDLNQAQADGRQATIDVGQAQLDQKQAALDASVAAKELATAIREHGKGSIEARQAQLDLQQAQQDGRQAAEDYRQAQLDSAQAVTDARSAQLDLNDAQREAKPPEMQKWADQLNLIAPLLSGLVGIIALVTAVQWAWNAAMTANPIGLIIVGVAALIAVIVLIATKTDWFQRLWRAAWGGIKAAASSTWEFLKKIPGWIGTAFKAAVNAITWPFRTAFNLIARAWNATIGRLRWSIPDWVPGIGGNTIAAPRLPTFHRGGIVPGSAGSEMLAVLRAGESVNAAGAGAATVIEIHSGGSRLDDLLVEILLRALRTRPDVRLAVSRG